MREERGVERKKIRRVERGDERVETVELKLRRKKGKKVGEGSYDVGRGGEGEAYFGNRRRMCTLKVWTPVGRDVENDTVFREIRRYLLPFYFRSIFFLAQNAPFPERLKLTAVVSCSVNEANYNCFLRNSMRLNVYGILTAHDECMMINITFYSFNASLCIIIYFSQFFFQFSEIQKFHKSACHYFRITASLIIVQ